MDVIVYHNNCPDGWCAAFIAKMKYPDAGLVALNHGLSDADLDGLIEITCRDRDVLMVDYSLRTRALNDRLNAAAKSFRILDHHKSAKEVLDGAKYATFDMLRSGAGLAWDYLFGADSDLPLRDRGWAGQLPGLDRPWWVDYTEDQDLWNWALSDSEEINAFLMVQPRTVEIWKRITESITAEEARGYGVGVREYINYYTRSVLAEIQPGVLNFDGNSYRAGVINIPYVGVSEAGNAIVKDGYQIAAAWFERGDGQIQFSLRSEKGGEVDCSAIARSFGGGGHQSAAGFQLPLHEGRDLVDKLLVRPSYVEKIAAELRIQNAIQIAKMEQEVIRSKGAE